MHLFWFVGQNDTLPVPSRQIIYKAFLTSHCYCFKNLVVHSQGNGLIVEITFFPFLLINFMIIVFCIFRIILFFFGKSFRENWRAPHGRQDPRGGRDRPEGREPRAGGRGHPERREPGQVQSPESRPAERVGLRRRVGIGDGRRRRSWQQLCRNSHQEARRLHRLVLVDFGGIVCRVTFQVASEKKK